LPYTLLITLAGNQTLFRTNRTYNLMNYGEFVLDEALELFLSYHMEGLILGRIPLIKKLQWRSVITAHSAFGGYDTEKNALYNPETNLSSFYTLSYQKPYVEVSYGIENIFKFFRIDLVQRITYLDNPDVHHFALKISGVFRF
jgi:hypothetical protein